MIVFVSVGQKAATKNIVVSKKEDSTDMQALANHLFFSCCSLFFTPAWSN